MDSAIAVRLEWFTRQGGKVDRSKFPSVKPALDDFFLDDDGNIWVRRVTAEASLDDRLFDIFDADGRFLGQVTLPFPLEESPMPIVRDGVIYAVTEDELEVPYVVRARIEARP